MCNVTGAHTGASWGLLPAILQVTLFWYSRPYCLTGWLLTEITNACSRTLPTQGYRQFEEDLAEACAPSHYNVSLLCYGALAGGALTDKVSRRDGCYYPNKCLGFCAIKIVLPVQLLVLPWRPKRALLPCKPVLFKSWVHAQSLCFKKA